MFYCCPEVFKILEISSIFISCNIHFTHESTNNENPKILHILITLEWFSLYDYFLCTCQISACMTFMCTESIFFLWFYHTCDAG